MFLFLKSYLILNQTTDYFKNLISYSTKQQTILQKLCGTIHCFTTEPQLQYICSELHETFSLFDSNLQCIRECPPERRGIFSIEIRFVKVLRTKIGAFELEA